MKDILRKKKKRPASKQKKQIQITKQLITNNTGFLFLMLCMSGQWEQIDYWTIACRQIFIGLSFIDGTYITRASTLVITTFQLRFHTNKTKCSTTSTCHMFACVYMINHLTASWTTSNFWDFNHTTNFFRGTSCQNINYIFTCSCWATFISTKWGWKVFPCITTTPAKDVIKW